MRYYTPFYFANSLCGVAQQNISFGWGRISLTEWSRFALLFSGQKTKILIITFNLNFKLSPNEENIQEF